MKYFHKLDLLLSEKSSSIYRLKQLIIKLVISNFYVSGQWPYTRPINETTRQLLEKSSWDLKTELKVPIEELSLDASSETCIVEHQRAL